MIIILGGIRFLFTKTRTLCNFLWWIRSNSLVDALEANGFQIRTHLWRDIICHCPIYFDMNIPVIYIYDNHMKSLSMKKRGKGYWDVNQEKLSNNYDVEYSDENLLNLMIN